ncbi:Putative clathrin assembly protein At1g03050 [Linum grandiflorum]
MAPSKIRRAVDAVKDQASISLAKVNNNSSSLSDLEVAIVKATRHEVYPAEERHIREILSLTSYSRAYISACVGTLSRRLNRTRNWTVALKTLMVIHRLLNEGDPAYEQEIFFATRRGTRILNMSDFVDSRSESSWDYSAFVRMYALYLDEKLEFKMIGRRGKRSTLGFEDDDDQEEDAGGGSRGSHGSSRSKGGRRRGGSAGGGSSTTGGGKAATPLREVKSEKLIRKVQHLQNLLDRFLACRPTGNARYDRVVLVAMYPIVKESFTLYYDATEILAVLIDRFMDMDLPEAVKIYEIFCRVSKQFDELESFYSWCKTAAIARTSEYPDVERISHKKLELMDDFLRDKSMLSQTNRSADYESAEEEEEFKDADLVSTEEDIKALPPPEEVEPVPQVVDEVIKDEINQHQQGEADLLNLGEYAMSSEDHSNELALALFNGVPEASASTSTNTPALTWEAFNNDDWETALVESASSLAVQKPAFPGGFDMTLLDGMYQQGATTASLSGVAGYGSVSGSASSVALGSAGRPAMLALPAPPTSTSSPGGGFSDPFAASMAVPPPSYVQMSEMEKKQQLLREEQLMWQQYGANGMQGHVGFGMVQQNSYSNMGGYTTHGYGY